MALKTFSVPISSVGLIRLLVLVSRIGIPQLRAPFIILQLTAVLPPLQGNRRFATRFARTLPVHFASSYRPSNPLRAQSRGTAAGDENVGLQFLGAHSFHLRRTNSEQNPGPMAASTE